MHRIELWFAALLTLGCLFALSSVATAAPGTPGIGTSPGGGGYYQYPGTETYGCSIATPGSVGSNAGMGTLLAVAAIWRLRRRSS